MPISLAPSDLAAFYAVSVTLSLAAAVQVRGRHCRDSRDGELPLYSALLGRVLMMASIWEHSNALQRDLSPATCATIDAATRHECSWLEGQVEGLALRNRQIILVFVERH